MEKIQAYLIGEIISSNTNEAHTLYKKSCFGEPIGDKIQYSLSETLFLIEKRKSLKTSLQDKKLADLEKK